MLVRLRKWSMTGCDSSCPNDEIHSRIACSGPFRICVPSGRSQPDIRVSALNGTTLRPSIALRSTASSPASASVETPSVDGSPIEASTAARMNSFRDAVAMATNSQARRLPSVMVPVLSSSTVLMLPAVSSA